MVGDSVESKRIRRLPFLWQKGDATRHWGRMRRLCDIREGQDAAYVCFLQVPAGHARDALHRAGFRRANEGDEYVEVWRGAPPEASSANGIEVEIAKRVLSGSIVAAGVGSATLDGRGESEATIGMGLLHDSQSSTVASEPPVAGKPWGKVVWHVLESVFQRTDDPARSVITYEVSRSCPPGIRETLMECGFQPVSREQDYGPTETWQIQDSFVNRILSNGLDDELARRLSHGRSGVATTPDGQTVG